MAPYTPSGVSQVMPSWTTAGKHPFRAQFAKADSIHRTGRQPGNALTWCVAANARTDSVRKRSTRRRDRQARERFCPFIPEFGNGGSVSQHARNAVSAASHAANFHDFATPRTAVAVTEGTIRTHRGLAIVAVSAAKRKNPAKRCVGREADPVPDRRRRVMMDASSFLRHRSHHHARERTSAFLPARRAARS